MGQPVKQIEFFTINTKLRMLSMILTEAKKVSYNGARPGDHWLKSLMFSLLSLPGIHVIIGGSLNWYLFMHHLHFWT